MKLLTFTPTRVGVKAELYQGMITVEIYPEYQTAKGRESVYGWWQIAIGMRYWSRDKWYEGRGEYFPPNGLEAAKTRAEEIVQSMVKQLMKKLELVEGEKG